jgi:hypothetical protein
MKIMAVTMCDAVGKCKYSPSEYKYEVDHKGYYSRDSSEEEVAKYALQQLKMLERKI